MLDTWQMRWSTFAMPPNNSAGTTSSTKDATRRILAQAINWHSEVNERFLVKDAFQGVCVDDIVGIFYLGLVRLYERTKDETIARVIEASYLAMLSRVRQRSLIDHLWEGSDHLCRKWTVAIQCLWSMTTTTISLDMIWLWWPLVIWISLQRWSMSASTSMLHRWFPTLIEQWMISCHLT